jgi:hypothetical protein
VSEYEESVFESPDELIEMLHSDMCSYHTESNPCFRWKRDSSHYDFYEDRANTIRIILEPIVGSANLINVVRIVVRELGL